MVVDSAAADPTGRFRFSLRTGEEAGVIFLASARHSGISYFASPMHPGMQVPDPYNVVVYDTALVSDPADLDVAIRHVVLTRLDGGLQVDEIIDVAGLPDRTLVAVDERTAVWKMSLPADAHGITVPAGGLPREALSFASGEVGVMSWVGPAGLRIVLKYVLPGESYELSLSRRTGRLEVIVSGPGVDTRAEGLSEAQTGLPVDRSIQRYAGSDMAAGSRIAVYLSVGPRSRLWAWAWFATAAILAAAAGVVSITTRRASSRAS
jgi:hypothetical protein